MLIEIFHREMIAYLIKSYNDQTEKNIWDNLLIYSEDLGYKNKYMVHLVQKSESFAWDSLQF